MSPGPLIAFIGFGEAAQAFAEGLGPARLGRLVGYDRKTDSAATRAQQLERFGALGVEATEDMAAALSNADTVLSLVTADQSLNAARLAACHIRPGARFFDCNSVAPATKKAAQALLEAAGAHYADVAVTAPVRPLLLATPLLVSADADAMALAQALSALGFNARAVDGGVGRASAIKMIRSIMIKGLEALTAECVLAAYAAGVEDEVLASLDQSFPGFDWPARADYNLERMLVHGARRSAEMEASAQTAANLGLGCGMAAATAAWQARLARLQLSPPDTLDNKARAILAALGTPTS